MPEHNFNARVLTPEGEVFDGEVHQLSTRTAVGEFGVLANHVPVLARLRPTELRLHMPDGEVQRWAQAEGWLQVFANRATVLVGEAVPPGQARRRRAPQPHRGRRGSPARVRGGLRRPHAGAEGQGARRSISCRSRRELLSAPSICAWTSWPSRSD